MKTKEQSREELAASMGIDLSHLTEEEIEVNYRLFHWLVDCQNLNRNFERPRKILDKGLLK